MVYVGETQILKRQMAHLLDRLRHVYSACFDLFQQLFQAFLIHRPNVITCRQRL